MPLYVESFWHDEDPAGAFTAERGKKIEGGIITAQGTANKALEVNELREKEVALGNITGINKLDLSKGRIFKFTVTGDTIIQFINPPAGESAEVVLISTQDATGGHKVVVENIEWNNGEPALATSALSKEVIPLLILTTGTIIGFGGSSGFLKTTANITTLGELAGGTSTAKGTVAIGKSALGALTTGESNVAAGENALTTNKTGKGNIAIGQNALNKTTGSEATAVGHEALSQNTSNNVTAMGSWALASNTTGTGNSAFGHNAMITQKTGTNNSTFGANSLEKSTGNSNSSFGAASSENLSTGGENSAFGHEALKTATTGSQNTAFGRKALAALETSSKNTAFGYNAGGANKVGEANVFIGWESGAAELGSNKLYIHNNNSAEPVIFANFETREVHFNATTMSLYKGVAPVARAAAIASPAETLAALKTAVDAIRLAIQKIGITE